MSMTLANGVSIIEHQIVSGVDTPMYPVTKFKNVIDASGKELSNYDFIPLPYDGTNYDGASSNTLRFLGDDNAWRVIQDGTTSQKGVVQLEDTPSTSTTKAATSNAVYTVDTALTTFTGTTAPATYAALSQIGQSGESMTTAERQAAYLPYLDSEGHILSKFLPSYVDDVIEAYYKPADGKFYPSYTPADDSDPEHPVAAEWSGTALTGEAGKIYVDLITNKTYRWGGSAYAVISETLAIGTTAGTAYEGSAGAALAQRVDSLEAGNVVIKGKAATNASYADNTIDDGKIEVSVGSGDNPTVYTITVFDTTRVSAFLDKDELDIVTAGLNGTGITSAQSTAQKAAILNLIGYRDSTTGEFQMADSTHAGLMSAAQNNKLANAQEIIVTANGVTTAPTFASGSGLWYQTVGVDA